MKLSMVRLLGLASTPQILFKISSRLTGCPARDGETRRLDGATGAPEQRADPGHELPHAERLRHVVVGAGIEASNLVGLLAPRREHDDGHEGVEAAELLAHLVAVHVRQHEVQEDHVGALGTGLTQAFLAGGRRDHAIPLEGQRVLQPQHDVGLVFDDEDGLSGLHPLARASYSGPERTQPRQRLGSKCAAGRGPERSPPRRAQPRAMAQGVADAMGAPRQAMNTVEPEVGVLSPLKISCRGGSQFFTRSALPMPCDGST